jgi:hypothetical protein
MAELDASEVTQVSVGMQMVIGMTHGKCMAGFMLGGGLLGSALDGGMSWGVGFLGGFSAGATADAIAGEYFCPP